MGWAPAVAGPRGRARWRKESASTMIAVGGIDSDGNFLGRLILMGVERVVRLIRLDRQEGKSLPLYDGSCAKVIIYRLFWYLRNSCVACLPLDLAC